MGPCCERRNKCLERARKFPEPQRSRYVRVCQAGWTYWYGVNRISLERRGAVKSCAAARLLQYQLTQGVLKGVMPCGCLDAVNAQLHQCDHKDPDAPIECCPFEANGAIDVQCLGRLKKLYEDRRSRQTAQSGIQCSRRLNGNLQMIESVDSSVTTLPLATISRMRGVQS